MPSLTTTGAADPQDPMEAVEAGIDQASEKSPDQLRMEQAEENAVKCMWKEYETAREFDKRIRSQFAVDRRYAAGTAIISWAVSANLIGAFIDILVSFLYARNPDVSIKKAPKVDAQGTAQEDDFAKTCEIVVSSLWGAPTTHMKDRVRLLVRSVLSTGMGWLKAILVCKGQNIPQMKTQLNDLRDNIARLEALRLQTTVDENGNPIYMTEDNEVLSQEMLDAKTSEYRETEASLQRRVEVAERKMLAVDFVSVEDMQVSLDVRSYGDYLDANWVANRIYRPIDDLKAMFPVLTDTDIKKARTYHQRNVKSITDIPDHVKLTGLADETVRPEEAEQYVAVGTYVQSPTMGAIGKDDGIAYACIVELWDRRTNHVHTMIDGVDKWAKQPYQPDYATTRFFPYFGVGFYPTDGSRHPQSLVFRLRELQDEYCSTRSSLRRTRSRAVPGVIFDNGAVKPEDAKKLASATEQELVGIEVPNGTDIRKLFAEKPISVGDMRLYDTSPITADMEKISGVQEALQSSVSTEKTATEAEIQQSGFSARTTADRDILEGMMTDLAHYTLELALGALSLQDVQRIAGAKAFWPEGMAVDDLLTMVAVTIEAGTTGKPKSAQDKQAWGTILPILQSSIMQIHQAQMMGDVPLATALSEVVKETMRRMGDESDVTRFIPQIPQMPPPALTGPGDMGPGGNVPPAAPQPGAPAGPGGGPMPGAEPGSDDSLTASLDAALAPPELTPPELTAPV